MVSNDPTLRQTSTLGSVLPTGAEPGAATTTALASADGAEWVLSEARRYEDAWRPAPPDFFQQRATKFFSAADGRLQWARQGGRCALTDWPLSQDTTTENDHVIPKSKGHARGADPRALHQVRGHTAFYADEDGHRLFGKLSGLIYHQAAIRGSAAHGAVRKDYRLVPLI